MSIKFRVITKTSYKDFCDMNKKIQIVENDSNHGCVMLRDPYRNMIELNYDDKDIIKAVKCYGYNDPAYLLYLLVTQTNAIFLHESIVDEYVFDYIEKGSRYGEEVSPDYPFEEFTESFMYYVSNHNDF